MIFRLARPCEADTVYALYRSAVGSAFCVWNEVYPGMEEVLYDLETENLYVLTDRERIIGALSVVPENELDGLSCWNIHDGTQKEIARVVIAEAYRGRGLSCQMVQDIVKLLYKRGCNSIHLSVAKSNLPAYKTYIKTGFLTVGEAELYGNSYFLMESVINSDAERSMP